MRMPPGLNEAPNEDIADKASDSIAVGAMQGYCAVNSSVFEKVGCGADFPSFGHLSCQELLSGMKYRMPRLRPRTGSITVV